MVIDVWFQFIECSFLIIKASMFAGEQLIIMEMRPHTLYAGQTPALVHFYNQPTRKELNFIFLIFLKIKRAKFFLFSLILTWYSGLCLCGFIVVFSPQLRDPSRHIYHLLCHSLATRAQILQIGRKITKRSWTHWKIGSYSLKMETSENTTHQR